MAAKPFKSAIGFVDWNTAVIASGAKVRAKRVETITERALEHVERVVADHLVGSGADSKFQVRLRLYAGWHSGTTPSDYLQGIASVTEGYARRARLYREDRVIFLGGHDGLQPGNRLALVPRRLAPRHDVHLLDTLRYRDGVQHEKMTDTALAVDLLGLAHRKAADRYIVVSDDDDMLPGIFAAEATGADARMLSRPDMISRFMAHAKDLVHTYESVGT